MEPQRPPLPNRVTDPVTGELFSPEERTLRLFYKGNSFYFQSFETRLAFKKEPDKYMALRPEAGVPVSTQVRRSGPFNILKNGAEPDAGGE